MIPTSKLPELFGLSKQSLAFSQFLETDLFRYFDSHRSYAPPSRRVATNWKDRRRPLTNRVWTLRCFAGYREIRCRLSRDTCPQQYWFDPVCEQRNCFSGRLPYEFRQSSPDHIGHREVGFQNSKFRVQDCDSHRGGGEKGIEGGLGEITPPEPSREFLARSPENFWELH